MDIFVSGAKKLGLSMIPEQIEKFEIFYREIIDWNQRVNLTAITEYDEVQIKHFLDSLTIVPVLKNIKSEEGLKVLDIGTGAGFPGIPLKIILPDIKLSLLEATSRKIEFLQYITSTLGLKNVEIINGRAEDIARIARYRENFTIVISRAVAQLSVLAELGLPFCSIGGICIFPKKVDSKQEIEQSLNAIEKMGGRLREIKPITLEELDDNRHLVIIDKVKTTPDKYPRRPGIPEKRPIK
jgi:16S rRNA (guanine527-N7)-methyltransferase